ncbi:hypothetical protein CPB86DRAFT_788165 [Serendipita vermifera]|nr:hypothetical protein CPB86DRAFT_788165 [Serendipita vermifera]
MVPFARSSFTSPVLSSSSSARQAMISPPSPTITGKWYRRLSQSSSNHTTLSMDIPRRLAGPLFGPSSASANSPTVSGMNAHSVFLSSNIRLYQSQVHDAGACSPYAGAATVNEPISGETTQSPSPLLKSCLKSPEFVIKSPRFSSSLSIIPAKSKDGPLWRNIDSQMRHDENIKATTVDEKTKHGLINKEDLVPWKKCRDRVPTPYKMADPPVWLDSVGGLCGQQTINDLDI